MDNSQAARSREAGGEEAKPPSREQKRETRTCTRCRKGTGACSGDVGVPCFNCGGVSCCMFQGINAKLNTIDWSMSQEGPQARGTTGRHQGSSKFQLDPTSRSTTFAISFSPPLDAPTPSGTASCDTQTPPNTSILADQTPKSQGEYIVSSTNPRLTLAEGLDSRPPLKRPYNEEQADNASVVQPRSEVRRREVETIYTDRYYPSDTAEQAGVCEHPYIACRCRCKRHDDPDDDETLEHGEFPYIVAGDAHTPQGVRYYPVREMSRHVSGCFCHEEYFPGEWVLLTTYNIWCTKCKTTG